MGFVCFWFFFVKVSRRLDLVYGGGSVGLMGLVSQEVHRGGGHVLGYIYIYSNWKAPCSFGYGFLVPFP